MNLPDLPTVPRDFIGYGRNPPDPAWPGAARVALNFVLNYEEGGESTPLDGDPVSEGYLHEIIGAPPSVGVRNLNVESMYEYGSRAGFWRMHRLFTGRGLPLTVYAVGLALERNPAAAVAMAGAGWEVASHGWRWIDYQGMDEAEEREHILCCIDTIAGLTGQRPVGWYTGRISANTRRLVVEEGGFLYDSDSYADELPYWQTVAGQPHLVIPYTLDCNDFKYLLPNGFTTGDDFYRYLVDAFEQHWEEGAARPTLMSVGLHCRISGRPGRARALARFLDHVKDREGVWIATREQIARHWHQHHKPA
ncbi:putative urate catabolism protein [Methylomagnum ishizawai]|uniref:Putative urate catabolism protein n=1 Tax=Methylomagnum ishizawai TaxID=1760988 RepID=A0A1Y6D504_9GAMM|nr:allantoinase PuuE [Methylomagnum ishizawai]SMF95454.1 putative urate catabolism protein [Methylomagnum ishizawai]